MKLSFTEQGFNEYLYWQTQDRKTLSKINKLILSIERDGVLSGEGKPELLKYKKSYSRRIDSKNRLVYTVEDNSILIFSCIGHYEK